MKMYLSDTPLYNMPLDVSGMTPLGKETKVGHGTLNSLAFSPFLSLALSDCL
jgi:hypothetical protein